MTKLAILAALVLLLSGCDTRDAQIQQVERTHFDTRCAEAGGLYVPPTWPTGEVPAHCDFYFPNVPVEK